MLSEKEVKSARMGFSCGHAFSLASARAIDSITSSNQQQSGVSERGDKPLVPRQMSVRGLVITFRGRSCYIQLGNRYVRGRGRERNAWVREQ